jgi:shikimate kinase
VALPAPAQIYLVGFMGAGKTTLGAELAALLGWGFADLDAAIVSREGLSVEEIFRSGGEPRFRAVERDVLITLTSMPSLVVATGGGTYVAEANRSLVEAAGISVWLQVSLAEAMRRCAGGPPRPLWGAKADLESLYRYRTEFYRCARIAVDTDGETPARVSRRILQQMEGFGIAR